MGQPIKLIQVVSTSFTDRRTLFLSKSLSHMSAGPQKEQYKVGCLILEKVRGFFVIIKIGEIVSNQFLKIENF